MSLLTRLAALFLATAALLANPAWAADFGRPGEGFSDYVARLWREANMAPRDVYETPIKGQEELSLRLLRLLSVDLVLAREVAAFVRSTHGLAVAGADGSLTVWTDAGRLGATLPPGGASRLFWPGGPHLAVLSADGLKVFLLNLRNGRWAEGAHQTGGQVLAVALSEDGWLGLGDASGRLWAGPVLGPLRAVGQMERKPLALGFGRERGMLVAVDRQGGVLFCALRGGKAPERFTAPGGPFTAGSIADDTLFLTAAGGRKQALDLATRKHLAATPPRFESDLQLDQGRLIFRGRPGENWSRGLALEPVIERRYPSLWYSYRAASLRVDDLDGKERFYRLSDGLSLEPPPAADDWDLVTSEGHGRYRVGETVLALADEIYRVEGRVLLARFAPGTGWYLWWERDLAAQAWTGRTGVLPVRRSLLADQAPDWEPIAPWTGK